MKALILAAGIGSRISANVPKCLLPIQDKLTPLDIIIDNLKLYGVSQEDIHIVVGTEGDVWSEASHSKIRGKIKNVIFNRKNVSLDNSHSLQVGLNHLGKSDVIIIDGDVVFGNKLLDHLSAFSEIDRATLLSTSATHLGQQGGKIFSQNGQVRYISEILDSDYYPWAIYLGIAHLGQDTIKFVKKFAKSSRKVVDVFNRLAELGLVNQAYVPESSEYSYFNLNNQESLNNARQQWEKKNSHNR
jgi:choline kinase